MLCTVHIKMDYRSIFLCQVLFNLTKLGRGTIFFFSRFWSQGRDSKSAKPYFPSSIRISWPQTLSKKSSEKLSLCCSGWSCFYWRKALVAGSGAGLMSSLLRPENLGERLACPFKKRSNLKLWEECVPVFVGVIANRPYLQSLAIWHKLLLGELKVYIVL